MTNEAVYNSIGTGYAKQRRPEPYWAARIQQQLGAATTLINIGAGSGSYEPTDLDVIAVEPSETMIAQRPGDAAPVVCGVAEHLPFADGSFDVALAVLTIHHWSDAAAGLSEMQRVARKQIIVTWDADVFASNFWLVRDYLPEIGTHEQNLVTLHMVLHQLPHASAHILPVPENCSDGVLGAYWKRPHAYLDNQARQSMSGLALLDPTIVEIAMARLQADLDSQRWHTANKSILSLNELDVGYRIVVAE